MAALGFGAGLGLGGLGCESLQRISECKFVTNTANGAIARVRELDPEGEGAADPDVYAKIAEQYQTADERLGSFESNDQELVQAVSSYRGVLRLAAQESERYEQALRNLREATEEGNEQRVQRSERQLSDARARMTQAVRSYGAARARVEKVCKPR